MRSLRTLGQRLEEATVKRQGQILPTENEVWGFYGTVSSFLDGAGERSHGDAEQPKGMDIIWQGAFKAFLEVYPSLGSKAVREFLDSVNGRHFADSLVHELRRGDGARANRVVKAALRGAEGKWVTKELNIQTGAQATVPPGGTAEMAQNVKAIVDTFAAVRDQEAKKNWKQQAQAMHQLETQADALITAVRAWFTNSGRAPTYEISAGGAKGQPYRKVRVTIPEDKE
jgi:hypothetical protein